MESVNRLYLILFLISLGASAFFCSAETAFIGVQKLRLKHLIHTNHPKAGIVARIVEQPEKFLSTVLLCINFFETAVATLGTVIAISLWGENLGAAIATIVVTILTLVFAELIPKSLAARYGEKIALLYAVPIEFISTILYPFVYVLNRIGIGFTKLAGESAEPRPTISQEEFRTAITIGEAEGVWEEDEAEMLHKVFKFGDRLVREVMVPRTEIKGIPATSNLAEFLQLFAESRHSRFPIFEENLDTIVGVLAIKDVLLNLATKCNPVETPVTALSRPVMFVPETKQVGDLFYEMQNQQSQMAIVIDEYGGTAGLVTIENLVEEIVGELHDELTITPPAVQVIDEQTLSIEAQMTIEEVNELLNITIPSGDYETLAGFLLSELGHIPKIGEHIDFNGFTMRIAEMDGVRIKRVEVRCP
ncbi:MAG: hemolysin family protein [Chloroflexi bacterium]|nr:hemolysin family protein [Chloroflexota bacterium]MCL5075572.1 hemolysin family protein [Chloroflexota bacterium]